MSVSRLSRLEDIEKQGPGYRVQNWMRVCGWARQTFATDTKTGPFRWRWAHVAPSQLACPWIQEVPPDAHTGCHTLCKFVVNLQNPVYRVGDQDCRTTISSPTCCLWFSTGIISVYVVQSLTKAVNGEHPTSQQVGISWALRHKRPSMKSTSLEWVEKTSTPGPNNMMHVITNLARIFCGACGLGKVGDTSGYPPKTKSSKAECKDTCRVKSKKKTSRSNPLHPLDWEGRVFLFILSCSGFQVIFKFLTVSIHQFIRRMLAHLSHVVESRTKVSSFLGPPPKKVSSWFPLRTKNHAEVFLPWESLLRPDPPFRWQGYAPTVSWEPTSCICASVSGRTPACYACTDCRRSAT